MVEKKRSEPSYEGKFPDEALLYTQHPNGGLVFATAQSAVRCAAINRALSKATTWGEFRRMLPEGEWYDIVDMVEQAHGLPPDDPTDATHDMTRWDLDETPFRGVEEIPAAGDGEYPEWLQQAMDQVLPEDILSRWGKRTYTVFNGAYWHLDPANEIKIVRQLKSRGYDVRRADDLEFC